MDAARFSAGRARILRRRVVIARKVVRKSRCRSGGFVEQQADLRAELLQQVEVDDIG